MRVFRLIGLLQLACSSTLVTGKDEAKTTHLSHIGQDADPIYIADNTGAVQNPLNIGSMSTERFDSPRHRQEKAHLMKRMSRSHGKWTTSHPRHRLLEALRGFSKYREVNMAELDRWRNLYKNVGKKQKKVRT